jgi:hypothetical protein
VVLSWGSVLRVRCRGNIFLLIIIIHFRGNIFLLIIIKYKIPGVLSLGVKRSGREAEIHPELQNGEVVKSRHAEMEQLETEIK